MYLMIEPGIRGWVALITNQYTKANNPVDDEYNPNKENKYLIYLDVNNLYGWVMSQELPVGNFEWKDGIKHFDVMNVPDNGNKKYILEADLDNSCYCMLLTELFWMYIYFSITW